MAQRQEVGPVGVFTVASGLDSPSLIVLIDYKSLAEVQSARARIDTCDRFMSRLLSW